MFTYNDYGICIYNVQIPELILKLNLNLGFWDGSYGTVQELLLHWICILKLIKYNNHP